MDASSVVAGAQATETALDGVRAAEQRSDAATDKSTQTTERATKADRDRANALDEVRGAIDPAYNGQKRMNDILEKARTLAAANAISLEELRKVEVLHAKSMAANGASAGAMRASYSNLGAQISDITSTLALGINPMVVFGQQAGQTAAALSGMGGTVGKVATFLSGPWGAAILGAVTVAGMLTTKFFEAEKASDDLSGALDFQRMTTQELNKAIKEKIATDQKSVEVSYAAAEAARAEAKANLDAAVAIRRKLQATLESQNATATSGRGFGMEGAGATAAGINNSLASLAQQDALISNLEKDLRLLDIPVRRREAEAASNKAAAATLWYEKAEAELQHRFEIGAIDADAYQKQLGNLYGAREKEVDAIRKAEGASDREAKARARAAKQREREAAAAARQAKVLSDFGDRSAESIKKISEQFDEQPKFIDQATQATRRLDTLIEELGKRKPPNFKELIADAQQAKVVIQDAILRPIDDIVKASERRRQIDELNAANMSDQAQALQIMWGLEDKLGDKAHEYYQEILDTVVAERELNEELAKRTALQDDYLSATKSVRQEIEAILSGTGKLSNIKQIFKNLQGKVLAEQLFGDVFRDLDKYVRDNTSIKSSVDVMATQTERAGASAGSLADALDVAAARISGASTTPSGAAVTGSSGIAELQKSFDSVLGKGAANATSGNEIVVNAIRGGAMGLSPDRYFDEMFRRLSQPLLDKLDDKLGTNFFSSLSGVLGGAVSGYLTAGPAGGVLGALKNIESLPQGLKDIFDTGLKGAQTGTAISGLGNMLGIKNSSGGAQIGGALGAISGIPGGEILGSIAGGLLGNLFKTSRTAGATITGLDDVALAGKDSKNYGTASGLAGSVTSSLANIVDQLGATIGDFRVTIGTRGDDYRVNTSGGSLKTGNGAVNFGDDEAGAIAYAIADAIADGAIQGISPAVAKALALNKDIEKGLSEALKVQDLEKSIKYMGQEWLEQFDDFAKTAADRVELAKKYGVDLLAVEALNAKERNELIEQAMEAQVGSLQDLVNNLKYGSLFEGSAVDQRAALIDEIAKARTAALAGEDGAADTLASLLEQLNTVSKNVFGTTGGFAGDRNDILASAQEVITQAQARIEAASTSSNTAAALTNTALDENNDQNAQMIAQLTALNLSQTQLNSLISAVLSGNSTAAAAALARTS